MTGEPIRGFSRAAAQWDAMEPPEPVLVPCRTCDWPAPEGDDRCDECIAIDGDEEES